MKTQSLLLDRGLLYLNLNKVISRLNIMLPLATINFITHILTIIFLSAFLTLLISTQAKADLIKQYLVKNNDGQRFYLKLEQCSYAPYPRWALYSLNDYYNPINIFERVINDKKNKQIFIAITYNGDIYNFQYISSSHPEVKLGVMHSNFEDSFPIH